MSSEPSRTGECRLLHKFKEFLDTVIAVSPISTINGYLEGRACISRNSNDTYPVSSTELRAEVDAALWNYLTARNCPHDFKIGLIRTLSDVVEREAEDNNNNDGSSPDKLYDLVKLQKLAVETLENLLTRFSSNVTIEELRKYVPNRTLCSGDSCTCEWKARRVCVAAAVKNKPRKMEDRYCCWERYNDLYEPESPWQYSFHGVFDGHSGPSAAAFVTSQLPRLCADQFKRTDSSSDQRLQALKAAFIEVDKMFAKKQISSGTTAVCLLNCEDTKDPLNSQSYLAWVGDSKAMLVSRGGHTQLVRPHKPDCPEERHRIEANSGSVIFVQGQWRVNGILNISRSIGDYLVNAVIAEPGVLCIDLTAGDDFLILGTDGFWDYVSEEEAVATVYSCFAINGPGFETAAKLLIELAKAGDSPDNITVVVVLLRDPAQIVADSDIHERPQTKT